MCCRERVCTSYVHHSRHVMASPGSAMLKYAAQPLKGSRVLQAAWTIMENHTSKLSLHRLQGEAPHETNISGDFCYTP